MSTTFLLGLFFSCFFFAAAEQHGYVAQATCTYQYVNYTALGYVTSVKDQKRCDSSYAFAAVAAVESQYLKNGLGTKDFSEQQIVDCTFHKYDLPGGPANWGCGGGNPTLVMQYFNETNVVQESAYLYKAVQQSCGVAPSAKPRNLYYASVQPQDENHLAYMLNKNGPIVVFVSATGGFLYYSKGIYNDAASCNSQVNHALLLVGIMKDSVTGQEFWILKNSWGTTWGEQGYVRLAKGKNMCNLAKFPATAVAFGARPIVS